MIRSFLTVVQRRKILLRQAVANTGTKVLPLSLFVLGAFLVFAACSSTPSQTPTPTPTPSQSEYPVTVTDFLGRSVQVAQKPASIVTTHPTATEMLYQVGGTAIGRDSSSKYPDEVQALPTVGSAYNLNVEAISALNPDLIIIEALTQGRFIEPLMRLAIPVVAVRAASLEDIFVGLILAGKLVDKNDGAAQAVAQIQDRIDTAQTQSGSGRNVLILISDAQRNVYAAKPESYPGTVAALLDLGNFAAGLPESGPYPGFALFTAEQALTSNPEVVFTISPAPPPAPKLSELLSQIPGFNQMASVKAGRVMELDSVLFLQAQGPRIADAVEEMLRLMNVVAP